MTLDGPHPVVNTAGYYTWWLLFGWALAAHRFYMGDWCIGIAWLTVQIGGWIAFIIWASVMLFSVDGTAALVPMAFGAAMIAVSISWVFDGFRGCTRVEQYNDEVDLSDVGEDFARKSAALNRRLGQLGYRLTANNSDYTSQKDWDV